MPSTTQRRGFVAASVVITLVLLALLVAQRYVSPAAMHRSDVAKRSGHRAPGEAFTLMHAFCNATGGTSTDKA